MNNYEGMCMSIEQASRNRERIANGENTIAYHQQEAIREGWAFGTIAPSSLVTGELPQVRAKRLHPFAVWRYAEDS